MQAVAVGWQIYALTHSTFQLGLVGLAQFLPMVLLTLPAGHAADRYNRRMICVIALSIQAAAIGFLALGTWQQWITVPGIFGAVTLIGAARAFERPANQSLMSVLVPAPSVPKAVAWASSGFQMASILGPALGGVLYAVGAALPYAAAGALAAVGVILIARVSHREARGRHQSATLASLFAGIGFIRRQPVILGSISLDLFAVLLGGATALLPAFAHDILHVGAWGLGALRAAPAVGSLGMSGYLMARPLQRHVGSKMFAAVLVFGVATIVFGASHSFALSLAALAALRGRRDQRRGAQLARAVANAGRDARPGERGERAVHRHFEPAWRIRVGRHRRAVRHRAGHRARRRRHRRRRAALDALFSRVANV